MRDIKDIRDVNQALKEINDRLDAQRTQTWDLHQRNIKNVAPSVNDYDVVVRRELIDTKGTLDDFITKANKRLDELEKLVKNILAMLSR